MVVAMPQRLLTGLVLLFTVLTSSCDTQTFECDCLPCGAAIVLVALDTAGTPQTGAWSAVVTLDGVAVEANTCDEVNRDGANECGFGFASGVYQIVVRSPNGEKSLAARFSSKAGQDCCACLASERVQVVIP